MVVVAVVVAVVVVVVVVVVLCCCCCYCSVRSQLNTVGGHPAVYAIALLCHAFHSILFVCPFVCFVVVFLREIKK